MVSAEGRERNTSHGVETHAALLQKHRNIYSYIRTVSLSPIYIAEVKHEQPPVWLKGMLGKKKKKSCMKKVSSETHSPLQGSIPPPTAPCPTLTGCLRLSQGVPLEENKHMTAIQLGDLHY